ncbi:unnamed protein product [Calicophoron daubneyi]|uniref:Myb/SANT-like DNA-binding domain-containing protein n=1 Tax=Calicophoron daubneyi TaxID=300641 RepID=A0AAV2TSE6_CALDB
MSAPARAPVVESAQSKKTLENMPHRVPFSKSESEMLLELMRRSSWMIYGVNKPSQFLDKTVWMQISTSLQACGLPKRTWQELRTKGKELMERNYNEQETLDPIVFNPDLYPKDSLSSTLQHPGAPPQLTTTSPAMGSIYPSVYGPMVLPFQPGPRLDPFLQAPPPAPLLENMLSPRLTSMPMSSSTGHPVTSFGFTVTPPTEAYVLRVCSAPEGTQMSYQPSFPTQPGHPVNLPHVPASVSSFNCYGPAVELQPSLSNPVMNGGAQDVWQPNRSTLHPTHAQNQPAFSSYKVRKNSAVSVPSSAMREVEFEQKMRIYSLKSEILQLKRRYWLKKLSSV